MATLALAATIVTTASPSQVAPSRHETQPHHFEADSGESVDAELHSLVVPAVRGDDAAGAFTIHWVRLPARGQPHGAPVVYLAGGPGGSGIAAGRGPRFELFERIREHHDVILLDQRGTGRSRAHPRYVSSVGFGSDTATDRETTVRLHRKAFDQALAAWRADDTPLRAYTTVQNALDLDDVRRALKVDKIHLLGISYGTHLALTAMRELPDSIDRVVLASVEGPDDTVKLPARTDAYFARLQAAIDRDEAARERYPDLRAMIRRVLARLDTDPPSLRVSDWGGVVARRLGRFTAQRAISYSIADPTSAAKMLAGVRLADRDGDFSWFANWGWLVGSRLSFDPLSTIADLASGVSSERAALVDQQRKTALLGDATNFPMPHLADLAKDPANDFVQPDRQREPVTTKHATLILSGTLDGRTYPAAAREIGAGLENAYFVSIENAGHNLLVASKEVQRMITGFLDGDEVVPETSLVVPAPDFIAE